MLDVIKRRQGDVDMRIMHISFTTGLHLQNKLEDKIVKHIKMAAVRPLLKREASWKQGPEWLHRPHAQEAFAAD